ncbi:MAG: aspartate carbamoyltransferase catalytic subunit [Bacillota bacterium]|nr:aspartate carbamoyltransferase catalytic subunit [Bacillota bacterium]
MSFRQKDLLGLRDLPPDDIRQILHSAETMRFVVNQPIKRAPHLLGKSIVELFYKESTRTRLSFSLATKYMQGTMSSVSFEDNENPRESLVEIAKTLDRMGADTIIIRHPMSGAAELAARNVRCSVINAGDGFNEHPTQALVDLFTILQHKGHIAGLRVAIVGDIMHSRVAKSNIYGLTKLGAKVSVGAPATLLPSGLERLGVEVFSTLQEAIIDSDVVMVVQVKEEMLKELRVPSKGEYGRFFSVNDERMKIAKPDAVFLHSGPIIKGVEVSSDIINSPCSLVEEQVTNGVAVQMAILHMFSKRVGANEITY